MHEQSGDGSISIGMEFGESISKIDKVIYFEQFRFLIGWLIDLIIFL